ncbi:Small integral membrane protein 1 [Collichthys lucidus]|uniref:Small integral membrane protein 1 n=1 Tax=Collichthys lucidus TaxID=240159 RepID=A0A4U5UQA8_COLLU|nr:Small integral membrane protein 1 [Collichthys lucidus]
MCPKSGRTAHMRSNSAGNVQYDRWNEGNIDMNVEASQSTMMRLYYKACIGSTGVGVKTAGALAALVSIYILGYLTGYYIHRC